MPGEKREYFSMSEVQTSRPEIQAVSLQCLLSRADDMREDHAKKYVDALDVLIHELTDLISMEVNDSTFEALISAKQKIPKHFAHIEALLTPCYGNDNAETQHVIQELRRLLGIHDNGSLDTDKWSLGQQKTTVPVVAYCVETKQWQRKTDERYGRKVKEIKARKLRPGEKPIDPQLPPTQQTRKGIFDLVKHVIKFLKEL